MFGPVESVRIALGTVVLDSLDQSGRYIAKDMVGGWAYLIADKVGDTRSRSQGGCPGGLDVQLRCAFLLAASQVPDSRYITVLVETRQAHRMMVKLAKEDVHVVAAIAGRPVSVMTRPDERSSFQVRAAAERAASAMLREREHAEWLELTPSKKRPLYPDPGETAKVTALIQESQETVPVRTWRSNLGPEGTALTARSLGPPRRTGNRSTRNPVETLVLHQPLVRSATLTNWLAAFNKQVAAINTDEKTLKL